MVRLSCAAVVCLSQMQFYYDGRRQLQPLVRLRTDNRCSAPTPTPTLERPRHRFLNNHRGANGLARTTLGPHQRAGPLPHETFIAVLLHDGANAPDGCVWFLGAV